MDKEKKIKSNEDPRKERLDPENETINDELNTPIKEILNISFPHLLLRLFDVLCNGGAEYNESRTTRKKRSLLTETSTAVCSPTWRTKRRSRRSCRNCCSTRPRSSSSSAPSASSPSSSWSPSSSTPPSPPSSCSSTLGPPSVSPSTLSPGEGSPPLVPSLLARIKESTAITTIVETFYNDRIKPQRTSNCSWTSCREGCTKELYDCTQIRVNYKLPINTSSEDEAGPVEGGRAVGGVEDDEESMRLKKPRYERALRDYDYIEDLDDEDFAEDDDAGLPKPFPTALYLTSLSSRVRSLLGDNETKFAGLMGNDSEWYFTGAKLFPNVKGCGYPPVLNCSIFYQQYANIGHNFSCYYSKVDPGIVISELDMWQTARVTRGATLTGVQRWKERRPFENRYTAGAYSGFLFMLPLCSSKCLTRQFLKCLRSFLLT
uniref:Uncharacterized protein n=1 Tax=Vespula pensylvanica TaxID=30213 RepID=A0A834UBE2_VESPE|nr:hypothetical protein H0235_007273 [Vespula pensylvanica]